MEFLGLDLSNVPSQNLTNPTVYVIPLLYVVSSIFSMKLSTNATKKKKDEEENTENNESTELDTMEAMNKKI